MSNLNHSPWGWYKPEDAVKIADGIERISTASHGGFKLEPKQHQMVPKPYQLARIHPRGPWYEEDCEWAFVAVTFPHIFLTHQEKAIETIKDHFPDEYTEVTGEEVKLEESYTLRNRKLIEDNQGRWAVISASRTEDGKVKCTACQIIKKGDIMNYAINRSEQRTYIVPKEEYQNRSGSFIIDENRHELVS